MAFVTPTDVATGEVLTASRYNQDVVENTIALPRGIVAYAEKTSDQTGISAAADITGLSVAWTADSSRYYRISLYLAPIRQNTSPAVVVPVIADGSSTTKVQANLTLVAGDFGLVTIAEIVTGLSGSITRKARISATGGTVDVLAATATEGNYLIVEDLGQA